MVPAKALGFGTVRVRAETEAPWFSGFSYLLCFGGCLARDNPLFAEGGIITALARLHIRRFVQGFGIRLAFFLACPQACRWLACEPVWALRLFVDLACDLACWLTCSLASLLFLFVFFD